MRRDIKDQFAEGRTKTVLVVDDESEVRMLAIDLFEDLGFEVLAASSGAEALAKLEAHPEVSLMFTDCRMPGMTGPELAHVAAERWPQLRIVLVTGYYSMQAPAWPIIWKPFDASTIERVIDNQLSSAGILCRPVQDLPHPCSEFLDGERFADKLHAGIEHAIVDHRVSSVAGREQHFELGSPPECLVGELRPFTSGMTIPVNRSEILG